METSRLSETVDLLKKKLALLLLISIALLVLLILTFTMTAISWMSSSSNPEVHDFQNRIVFADTVSEVTYTNGNVRMDLVALSGKQNGQANPEVPAVQVIMSPNGFLRGASAFTDLIEQLDGAGMLNKDQSGQFTMKVNGE